MAIGPQMTYNKQEPNVNLVAKQNRLHGKRLKCFSKVHMPQESRYYLNTDTMISNDRKNQISAIWSRPSLFAKQVYALGAVWVKHLDSVCRIHEANHKHVGSIARIYFLTVIPFLKNSRKGGMRKRGKYITVDKKLLYSGE